MDKSGKMRKKRKTRKTHQKSAPSAKIELSPNRAYRITDPHQLSFIIFPHKNACMLRAAFIAIFFEIRNDPYQQLEKTEFIAEKHEISLSAVCKARDKMVKLGLIQKKDGYWQYSNRFFNALEDLIETIDAYRIPTSPKTRDDVFSFVNVAKNLKSSH